MDAPGWTSCNGSNVNTEFKSTTTRLVSSVVLSTNDEHFAGDCSGNKPDYFRGSVSPPVLVFFLHCSSSPFHLSTFSHGAVVADCIQVGLCLFCFKFPKLTVCLTQEWCLPDSSQMEHILLCSGIEQEYKNNFGLHLQTVLCFSKNSKSRSSGIRE